MELALLAILAGIGVGFFSGMLGIGGGTIMVPLFRLAFGLSAIASTGTSMFAIIPTAIAGAITHIRNKTCIPELGIVLGIGGALTSPLGVLAANHSPSWCVMLAAGVVILYSATTMFRKALALGKKAPTSSDAASETAESDSSWAAALDDPSTKRKVIAVCAAIGIAAGFVSGYVGVGGGFIMVPLLLSVAHLPMKRASGTSLIAVAILALPAAIGQLLLGNVNLVIGIALACGSIPGALVGARLVARVPERALRFVFAGFLGIAAILLVVKEIGLLA